VSRYSNEDLADVVVADVLLEADEQVLVHLPADRDRGAGSVVVGRRDLEEIEVEGACDRVRERCRQGSRTRSSRPAPPGSRGALVESSFIV
jgi:hypothetical protein